VARPRARGGRAAQELTEEQLREMAQRAQQADGAGAGGQGQELHVSLEGMEGGAGDDASECGDTHPWKLPSSSLGVARQPGELRCCTRLCRPARLDF